MIVTRFAKRALSNKKTPIPKPPKFLSGELESFRYSAEDLQLFDGYSPQELYGAKIGPKQPPAVRMEMKKDTIASTLLFFAGLGIIFHIHNIFVRQHEEVKSVNDSKFTRQAILP